MGKGGGHGNPLQYSFFFFFWKEKKILIFLYYSWAEILTLKGKLSENSCLPDFCHQKSFHFLTDLISSIFFMKPELAIPTHRDIFLFFFSFTLFHFTILYWFCHTSTWIHHRYTCVPNHESFSHLPPHTISLGHPSAPAPNILYSAGNLDWRFVSYMILCMFQYHSPKSSHPRPLPQSPKDCSIHLCLFCQLTYRVIKSVSISLRKHWIGFHSAVPFCIATSNDWKMII